MAVGRPAPTSRANVGPDSTAVGTCGAEHLGRDLVRQLAGLEFEALRGPGHAHARAHQRRHRRQAFAKAVARHGDQQFVGGRAPPSRCRRRPRSAVRKAAARAGNAGCGVPAASAAPARRIRPQSTVAVARAREVHGQRRAPRTRRRARRWPTVRRRPRQPSRPSRCSPSCFDCVPTATSAIQLTV